MEGGAEWASESGDVDRPAGPGPDPGAHEAQLFRSLFEANFDRLCRFVRRYLHSAEEAEDVVHDVFVRVWRERHRLMLNRDLGAYLYTAAHNRALDRLKRRRVEDRWRATEGAARAPEPAAATDPATELANRDLAATIQRAIDGLPRRQRQVLELRWREHLTYDDIARRLRISPKTVAIHVGRALAQLRRVLPRSLEE